jgi:hypothetical protein
VTKEFSYKGYPVYVDQAKDGKTYTALSGCIGCSVKMKAEAKAEKDAERDVKKRIDKHLKSDHFRD